MYTVAFTARFKKDVKAAQKRGCDMALLEEVVALLMQGNSLPKKYHDHQLSGAWSDFRECHIQPDWLLLYRIDAGILVLTLTRTGTHSDLF